MISFELCDGYACPPGNKVPAGDVIVHLATTGTDPALMTGGGDRHGGPSYARSGHTLHI